MAWWRKAKTGESSEPESLRWLSPEGEWVELGLVTREDLKLLAYLHQELHSRRVGSRSSQATLARLRQLTQRLHERTRAK